MMRGGKRGSWLLLVALVGVVGAAPLSAQVALDEFEDLSGWRGITSPGSELRIVSDIGHTGMAMRLDFDFHGGGGYVIARKALSFELPENYAFKFYLRGQALPNTLQFKLIDRKDRNVWWSNEPNFAFPSDWQQFTVKKARIQFAWGTSGGTPPLRSVSYIEFAILADTGGKGSVWIDDLRLEEREPDHLSDEKPTVTAATSRSGHEPGLLFDRDPQNSWQWVLIDFRKREDYGGLVIDWDPQDYATAYQVQISDDATTWTTAYRNSNGRGGRDYIYLHDAESRYIRLALEQSSRGQGYAIRELTMKPFAFSASPNDFFAAIAAEATPGTYPKYFSGQQTYWTVIGVDGDGKEGLLNEEGMLEVDTRAFSIEPFLYMDGQLITWKSVRTTQELESGYLPIPTVVWHHDRVAVRITAFAGGDPWASTLYARYRVQNRTDSDQDLTLFLAIRPFQVLPPWQFLNIVGGATPIRDLDFDAPAVRVNHAKVVLSLTPPDHFGAAAFDEDLIAKFLTAGTVPAQTHVSDPLGYAAGALQYRLTLPPGAHADVDLAIPWYATDVSAAHVDPADATAQFDAQLKKVAHFWDGLLGRVDLQLPPAGAHVARTVKTTLAYILINRDGPAIQPGSRNYARSWIRDGAVTSSALLEMGFTEEVREFIRWFARYQSADGKVPCCIDRRGADPVPEHDSNGAFIFTIAEYYRFTRDVGFLHEMWPAVLKAANYIAALQRQRLTDAFRQPETRKFYGLLPESISHEGYASHPVHSYWDDFFALRGLKDAASLALVLGDDEAAGRLAGWRDELRGDLYASIARVMTEEHIDFIPASAELADFDPNSTAMAVTLASEQDRLPQPALTHTFDKYYEQVVARQHADMRGTAYSPYELRNVHALVRLGQRARANEILDLLMADQRPPAWNEWQEVVWYDPTTPRFIGDMPHTWVGSIFIRAVRSMFVYEREADRALVIAAGLRSEWVMSDAGVTVKRLPTYYGVLSYHLQGGPSNSLRLQVSGDLTLPPGNIVVQPPLPQPLKAVQVNGRPIQTFTADSATISEFPADVVLDY
jgi:hypothetical protein